MKNVINRFFAWLKKLPDKKHHVEFITAVLSVPVMLTVIILNLNNLNNANQKQNTNQKVTPVQIIITGEKQNSPTNIPNRSTNEPTNTIVPTQSSCIKKVGPVSIISPLENEVVINDRNDPVCIDVITEGGYCSSTWSYRLNNGNWSGYTNKNICLYNLTNGNKVLQMKFRSTASDDEVTLQRSFIYQGNNEPTVTPTTSTSSAGLQ